MYTDVGNMATNNDGPVGHMNNFSNWRMLKLGLLSVGSGYADGLIVAIDHYVVHFNFMVRIVFRSYKIGLKQRCNY